MEEETENIKGIEIEETKNLRNTTKRQINEPEWMKVVMRELLKRKF